MKIERNLLETRMKMTRKILTMMMLMCSIVKCVISILSARRVLKIINPNVKSKPVVSYLNLSTYPPRPV